ncbi:MAG: protease HtpX [Bdellovibrionales bacterium]
MYAVIKRMALFFTVNILILVTLSIAFQIIASMFGISLGDTSGLWLWYGVIGMGGAFINLAMSRMTAKWMMGVKVIDPRTQSPNERRLVEVVHTLAQRARLPAMPEVGIYDSPEVNAFATGPSKARSLVAVSTGLLGHMDQDSVEGVLGHEITHIANGDMVTMTLIQGVINTMVLIVARVLATLISSQAEERSRPMIQLLVFYLLQIVLSLFGSMIVCYFSRAREFRADAGGARLAGRDRMLSGLNSLKGIYEQVDVSHPSVATLKIAGRTTSVLATLFATHPPLEERIQRLQKMVN